MDEEMQEKQKQIEEKLNEMKKFREEMKERRINEQIQQNNPFSLPKTSLIDRQLEELRKKEENEKSAGQIQEGRIESILKKVQKSIGMEDS